MSDNKETKRIKDFDEELKDYQSNCREAKKYATERFDILIISLSTSALGFSLAFLEKGETYNHISVLQITWILFASSIILNLLSQVTSYFGHSHAHDAVTLIIKSRKQNIEKPEIQERQREMNFFKNATDLLNAFALLTLISGIIAIITFMKHNT